MKPIAYDLCCGSGGWAAGLIAAGWHVIGYDIDPMPGYPGEFRQRSVLEMSGDEMRDGSLIVASPPCQEFSRHDQPWTRAKNPPPPDLSIWKACLRIASEAGLPIVIENVRGAQRFVGKAKARVGSFYLFGDVPSGPPSNRGVRQKQSYTSSAKLDRARVPVQVGEWIGAAFMPMSCVKCGHRFDRRCGIFGCPNCMGEGIKVGK